MEFFNRKEEVIDIQLTQHGKYLLSKGRLSPKYYAFYDDDVIYDTQYAGDPVSTSDHAGFGEHPSEAEGRITTTPRVKAQYVFEGAETRVAKIKQSQVQQQLPNDEGVSVLEPSIPTTTNTTNMSAHLGTSAFNSTKAPAWNIKMLDGQITGSVHYFAGSTKVERIPQLEIISTTKVSVLSAESNQGAESVQLAEVFDDGSSFQVLNDSIILDIEEVHSARREFNFDIEVFEVETDENGNEELRPLRIQTPNDNLLSGLSIETDGDLATNMIGETAENQNYSHYYIDVNMDNQVQIPSSTPQSTTLDPDDEFIADNDFDCPDDEEA